MSQTIIDPRVRSTAPPRESAPRMYDIPIHSAPTALPDKTDALSLAALVCAVVGIGVATIPLIVSGIPTGLALGIVSVGLVLGVLAAVLGTIGRGRAVSKGLGMTGLVVSILALLWTIGGFACTLL